MYFVDLFAVSLVSWIWMIDVLFRELFIRLCKFCNDVLNDDAFHVIMFVACYYVWGWCGDGWGWG